MNQIDLNNKTAVITGGAQGFGYSMVERFAKSGAKVVIWDKDKDLIDNLDLPNNVSAVQTDVTSYDSVENSVNETIEKNNSIDILVNNAGIAGPSFKTWEYPIDQWQNVVDIDLTGVFYCCRAVTPHMIKNNYGRIVNIASIAGKEGNPNAMPYSAAKAGVIALTKSLGKELSDKNIAVNCVTPAAAKTRIFDQISQEHIDYMLSKIPRGRFLKVDELASMVSWLVSEENSYTTGAVFDLSGGRATYLILFLTI
jgi:3-oxoacyl-[acyl-carrier protein] reductase